MFQIETIFSHNCLLSYNLLSRFEGSDKEEAEEIVAVVQGLVSCGRRKGSAKT